MQRDYFLMHIEGQLKAKPEYQKLKSHEREFSLQPFHKIRYVPT